MNKKIILMLSLCYSSAIFAYDNDERHDLQQQYKLNQTQQEEKILENTTIHYSSATSSAPQIDDEASLTQAIFINVNQQDWQSLKKNIARYQQLPEYSEVMVNFAYGALARENRKYKQAEQYFRKMVAIDPEFTRGQLELARILFENQKLDESKAIFKTIYSQMPSNIQEVIQAYLEAMDYRQKWQSLAEVGYLYQSNVNQKSGKSKCYDTFIFNGEEICSQLRTAEQAKSDTAWTFNVNTSKRWATGQHGLLFKGLSYGTVYDTESDYSNQTLNLALGYSFKNATQEVNILPFYERYWLASQSLYNAYGLHGEYNQQLSDKMGANIQLDYQYNQFKSDLQKENNGNILTLYTTLTHQISPKNIVFTGLNYANKKIDDRANSFNQYGARLGLYHIFGNGSTATALGMYKRTNYQDHNLFIDTHNPKNKELSYAVIYTMSHLKFKGFYPVLSYKYTQAKSNIDWFYAYHNQEVSVKLQKSF